MLPRKFLKNVRAIYCIILHLLHKNHLCLSLFFFLLFLLFFFFSFPLSFSFFGCPQAPWLRHCCEQRTTRKQLLLTAASCYIIMHFLPFRTARRTHFANEVRSRRESYIAFQKMQQAHLCSFNNTSLYELHLCSFNNTSLYELRTVAHFYS